MAQNSDIVRSLLALVIMAAIAGLIIGFSEYLSRERIVENRRNALLATLHQVLDPSLYDNDLLSSHQRIASAPLLNATGPVDAYLATDGGEPVAVLLTTRAMAGYNGAIELLVAVQIDGSLASVRVLDHRETPGLGDHIEADRSDWILQFNGLSLQRPDQNNLAVKSDGGSLDSITGATVTSRAVVKAVRNALLYFEQHQPELVGTWPTAPQPPRSDS
jgi:electron transport complex protein RnfG